MGRREQMIHRLIKRNMKATKYWADKSKEKDFYVECQVCKQILKNHTGSTPCCGSIAFIVDENGNTTDGLSLYVKIRKQ